MVQEVRSSDTQGVFDFNSQAGVLRILQAVRKSELPLTTQNELRDLIFLYTNSGGDQGMRTALEERLISNNIKPLPSVAKNTAKAQSEPIFGFAGSRPAPSFSANFTPVSVQNDTPIPAAVAETTPVVTTPEPVATPEPVVTQTTSEATPASTSEPVTVPVSEPVAATPEPAIPTQTTSAEPPATPPPVTAPEPVAPAQTAPAPIVSGSHLDRIKAIKSEVNRRFGNPVQLVDKDAELGREYMTSLLEAMKQLSAEGGGGNIENAMVRLEAAFLRVKNLDTETKTPEPVTENKISEKTPPTATEKVLDTQQKAVVPPRPPVQSAASSILRSSNHKIEAGALNATQVSEPPEVKEPRTSTIEPASMVSKPTEFYTPPEHKVDTVPVNTPNIPEVEKNATNIINIRNVDTAATPPVATLNAETPIINQELATAPAYNVSTVGAVSSVAAANAPLRTPDDLPDPKTISRSGSADPLFTEEVSAGLDQLLLEWVLFRKSGMFGTGPKGVNHPLFKKLAPMQIPLLLAGRFEGATQEIRQSITDYMNGWRYEQGIIYDKGETFEMYLRRVIRHIIDLQK